MVLVFVVVGAVMVFVIAAVLIGGESFRLGHTPAATVFDLDEAGVYVAERLSDEAAAGLTFDELHELLIFALEHLRSKGLSARPGEDLEAGTAPVVIDETDTVAAVLGRVDSAGMVVADAAVVEALDLLFAHLDEIGGVGPEAER